MSNHNWTGTIMVLLYAIFIGLFIYGYRTRPRPAPVCAHQWQKWGDPIRAEFGSMAQYRQCEICGVSEYRWVPKTK